MPRARHLFEVLPLSHDYDISLDSVISNILLLY